MLRRQREYCSQQRAYDGGRVDKGLKGVDWDAGPVSRRGEIYESDNVGMREKEGYEGGEIFRLHFTSIFAREIIYN